MPARRSFRLIARLAVYAAALLVVCLAPALPTTSTALTAPTAPTTRLVIAGILLSGLLIEVSARRRLWR